MENEKQRSWAWLVQAVKFGAVGVLNTAIDLGLYFVMTRWLGLGGAPVLAKGISYSAGILNSFLWNRNWTFKSRTSAWKTLIPFVLVNLVGLGINTGAMQVGLSTLHLPEIASLGSATVLTLAWNFMLSKFVVFRK